MKNSLQSPYMTLPQKNAFSRAAFLIHTSSYHSGICSKQARISFVGLLLNHHIRNMVKWLPWLCLGRKQLPEANEEQLLYFNCNFTNAFSCWKFMLLIRPLGTIPIKIHWYILNQQHLKLPSTKCRPFCSDPICQMDSSLHCSYSEQTYICGERG